MKKISPNFPCPCGSKNKYKKCCQSYHKDAKPKTALLLMKSSYVAYAVGDSSYSGEMLEKSCFLKVNGMWLYESGEIF